MRRVFYMALYGVFRMLMLSAKMPTLVRRVQAALGQGRACVIGMEQTGQAAMAQQDDAKDDKLNERSFNCVGHGATGGIKRG